MAKKTLRTKRNQAQVRIDWMPIPKTKAGGVWIDLRKDDKIVGQFQITQGAVYFYPKGAITNVCKKIPFERLAALFKEHGQDYPVA